MTFFAKKKNWIVLAAVIVLTWLIMLPRLMSPQFGLFDDGVTIETVESISEGNWITWDIQEGRFRPVYWLFYFVLYLVGGENPLVFFIGNTLLLATIVTLLTILITLWTSRVEIGALASVFLLTAPPTIELFYTLSKGEGLQVFWILLALLFITLFARRRDRKGSLYAIVLAGIAMLAACLSKETSIVMLPLSVAAIIIQSLARDGSFRWNLSNPYLQAALATMFSSIIFLFGWRVSALTMLQNSGGYAGHYSLDLHTAMKSISRWAGLLLGEFPYLLFVPVGVAAIWKRLLSVERWLVVYAGLWSAAWVAIFIPWGGIAVYFTFPTAAGFVTITALVMAELVSVVIDKSGYHEVKCAVLAVGILLLLIGSMGNAVTNGIIQLSTDENNVEALAMVARTAPPDSLVLVNIQDSTEYLSEISLHLRVFFDRPDLYVDRVYVDQFPPETQQPITVMAPNMHDAPVFAVRTGVVEPYINWWNDGLQDVLSDNVQIIAETIVSYRLFSFKLPKLVCNFVHADIYCRNDHRPLTIVNYDYGWQIYSIP